MSTKILVVGLMVFFAHFLSRLFRKTSIPDVLVLIQFESGTSCSAGEHLPECAQVMLHPSRFYALMLGKPLPLDTQEA